ncbi:O-linked N-acetylglucosamine transferase, SPINDLY family protein [Desulfonatronum parangueonense]
MTMINLRNIDRVATDLVNRLLYIVLQNDLGIQAPQSLESRLTDFRNECLQKAHQSHMNGDLPLAREKYLLTFVFQPRNPDVVHLLGVLYSQQGKYAIGLELLNHALAFNPESPPLLSNIAQAYKGSGYLQKAAAYYQQALRCDPTFHPARAGLTRALERLADQAHAAGKREEAVAWYSKVVEFDPRSSQNLNNMAVVLQEMGRIDEALEAYRKATIASNHNPAVHSNYLLAMNLCLDISRQYYLEKAKEYGSRQHHPAPWPIVSAKDETPLRLGYMSADFSGHAVSTFILPLLECHDPTQSTTMIFCNAPVDAQVAERLKVVGVDVFEITELNDEAALNLIRRQKLDILVDLSGHTARNRLPLMAHRAASVQAVWLGYFNTTGVPAMDYLIADERCCPLGEDHWFTEKIIRLPGSFFCYTPPDHAPCPAKTAPCLEGKPFTFGCFNEAQKLGPKVISVWSKILRASATSRLFLKARAFSDPSVSQRFIRLFKDNGVPEERLFFEGTSPHHQYLASFKRVDLCLDPFPYNGGTITCDSMLMGVPVLTLVGETMVSRMGYSILHAAGIKDAICHSLDEYIAKAVRYSTKSTEFIKARSELRSKFLHSELCNKKKFMMFLIAAFNKMLRDREKTS